MSQELAVRAPRSTKKRDSHARISRQPPACLLSVWRAFPDKQHALCHQLPELNVGLCSARGITAADHAILCCARTRLAACQWRSCMRSAHRLPTMIHHQQPQQDSIRRRRQTHKRHAGSHVALYACSTQTRGGIVTIVEALDQPSIMQCGAEHSADMENLVRRPPDIERPRPPSLGNAELEFC